ncbi:EthD domain-containing protein [Microbacterium aurantiacum]|uniref:EthD domain-containing protein n=1 Tax=Microbacterium aurantiacum TaxID=162393 RepID=UPI003D74D402
MAPAFKMVLLLRSRHDLTAEAFTRGWIACEDVAPTQARGLLDVVFDAPIATPAPIENVATPPFDAAVETWWERKNDAADWVVSASFTDDWLGSRRDLLAEVPVSLGGIPDLLWLSPADPAADAVKVLTLPVAPRRLRFAEFAEHWTGAHADLALSGPGTRERLLRLEDTPAPLPLSSRLGRARYDGVGALTFASAAALEEEFASAHYRENLAPDELRFTDPVSSTALVTREIRLR